VDHEQAKSQYRAAWAAFLLETDPLRRRELEKLMDEAQPSIATGPSDPAWKAFVGTLPGFKAFWTRAAAEGRRKIDAGR
jgi:hypothetical protein